MSNEFIEPTRESRRNLLLLIAIGIVVGTSFKFWLMPALFAHINSLPLCDRLRWLRACLLGAISTPPLFALWAIPHAIRLLKLNQSPLPGTWVFQRTSIQRGRVVRLRAYFLLVTSVAACAFPVFGLHLLQSTPFSASPNSCTDNSPKPAAGPRH
jgi:hypothetical protein